MKHLQRFSYAFVAFFIALASVLTFSGVGRAQAATVGSADTVPLGGTALDDQFNAVLRDAGVTPVTGFASIAGTALNVAGAYSVGLAIGEGGLSLVGYLKDGDVNAFRSSYDCSNAATSALVKTQNIVTLGMSGLSCNPKVTSSDTQYPGLTGVTVTDGTRTLMSTVRQSNNSYAYQCWSGSYIWGNYGARIDGTWTSVSKLNGPNTCPTGTGFVGSTTSARVKYTDIGKIDAYCFKPNYDEIAGTCSSVVTPVDGSTVLQHLSTKVTTSDGSTYSSTGGTWTRSSGLSLDSSSMGVNSAFKQAESQGKTVTHVTVTSQSSSTGDETTVMDTDTNKAYQTAIQEDPNCVTSTKTGTPCVLILYKIMSNGILRKCSDSNVWPSCADWYTQEKAAEDAHHDRLYKCQYGTASLDPLTGCLQYKDTYKHQYGTVTYTDPDTGQEIDPVTEGVTQSQPDSKNCWAQMISWNPADWVLTPIKCAAIWAFVPTETNSWQRVGTAWNETAPAVVARTLSGGIEMPKAGNGCSGPPLDLTSVSGGYLAYDGYPLSACDEPMKTMAQRFKLIAQVLLMASTLWMVIRNITAIFNVPPPPAAIQPTLF